MAAIKAGTEIALFDQNWPQQAAFGAVACAEFMKTGKVFPNIQVEHAITKANLAQGLAQLANFKKYALTGLTAGFLSRHRIKGVCGAVPAVRRDRPAARQ